MIIKELSFSAFCKIFKGHDDMLIGIGFTDHGTVDLLLTTAVTWYIARNAESSTVVVRGVASDEHTACTFTLNSDDFEEITIC